MRTKARWATPAKVRTGWMPQAFAPVLRRYDEDIVCVERRNTDNDRWHCRCIARELSARTLQRLCRR